MNAVEQGTILSVQQNDETRSILDEILSSQDRPFRTVDSPREALAILDSGDRQSIGLVLLGAPVEEAESVCRALRAGPLSTVPVLLTLPPDSEPSPALRELADDLLGPPINSDCWRASIRAWSRASALLIESRFEADRWRALFGAIDEGMALVDPDGLIQWCNPALARLLNTSESSLIGQSFADRAAALIPPGKRLPLDQTLRSGARSRDEWEKGHRWFRSTAGPIREESGLLSGIVVTLEEVTAEVRLRQRIAQVEAEADARSERIERLEREARLYQALVGVPGRADDLGSPRPPLSKTLPDVFCDALEDFGRALDLRLIRRGYRTTASPDGSALLMGLGERLAAAGARPRDVIELHAMALRQRSSGAEAAKINAFAEEAQVAVLEVMGRLVEHYRAGLANTTRPAVVVSDRSPDQSE